MRGCLHKSLLKVRFDQRFVELSSRALLRGSGRGRIRTVDGMTFHLLHLELAEGVAGGVGGMYVLLEL